jgi:hypothetical protein
MPGSAIIIVFIIFYIFFLLFYLIIIATSHIWGNDSKSYIYVGKDGEFHTGIGIPNHTRISLEVNTHNTTLDYFINDKHIKHRFVFVPKDVYFGV